jgi:hypothetical protein
MAQTEYLLDLFQPTTLIQTLKYQADTDADRWDQRHIDAMVRVCEYIAVTYPEFYKQIQPIHEQFLHKEANTHEL